MPYVEGGCLAGQGAKDNHPGRQLGSDGELASGPNRIDTSGTKAVVDNETINIHTY